MKLQTKGSFTNNINNFSREDAKPAKAYMLEDVKIIS